MVGPFAQHGEFSIHVEGRMIVSDVLGPWNRELVDNWARQGHGIAKALAASGPYVGINIIRGSMLCPPEAFEAMRAVVEYATAKFKCVGNVLVADANVEGRELLLGTYARLYDGLTPNEFVYGIDSARSCALAMLARHGY